MLKRIAVASGIALALTASGLLAGHERHAAPAAAKPKAAVFICPVMKNPVRNIKTAARSVYKGKTYYFCCPGCKPLFDKNPKRYLGNKS